MKNVFGCNVVGGSNSRCSAVGRISAHLCTGRCHCCLEVVVQESRYCGEDNMDDCVSLCWSVGSKRRAFLARFHWQSHRESVWLTIRPIRLNHLPGDQKRDFIGIHTTDVWQFVQFALKFTGQQEVWFDWCSHHKFVTDMPNSLIALANVWLNLPNSQRKGNLINLPQNSPWWQPAQFYWQQSHCRCMADIFPTLQSIALATRSAIWLAVTLWTSDWT